MSKAVLISIRPQWCEKIFNGQKTIEVRKTRPKMEPPFKCCIYCTQSADMLWISKERERAFHPDKIAAIFKAAKCGGAYEEAKQAEYRAREVERSRDSYTENAKKRCKSVERLRKAGRLK